MGVDEYNVWWPPSRVVDVPLAPVVLVGRHVSPGPQIETPVPLSHDGGFVGLRPVGNPAPVDVEHSGARRRDLVGYRGFF